MVIIEESRKLQPEEEALIDNTPAEVNVGGTAPQPPSEPKPAWKSKTLWFNTAVTIGGIAASFMPQLQPFMSAETYGLATAGVGVVNAALRFLTHKPVFGGKGSGSGLGNQNVAGE